MSFEIVRELKNASAYIFSEEGIQISHLMLTNNLELNVKKTRISRLPVRYFNSDLIRKFLPIYNNVMKCDEVKESDHKRNYHRFFHAS